MLVLFKDKEADFQSPREAYTEQRNSTNGTNSKIAGLEKKAEKKYVCSLSLILICVTHIPHHQLLWERLRKSKFTCELERE